MNENNEGTGVEKNIHLSDKTFSLWAEIKVHRVSFCQVFFFLFPFTPFFLLATWRWGDCWALYGQGNQK